MALDTVYSITSSGNTTYKIEGVQKGNAYCNALDKYIDAMNIKKVNRSTDKETDQIEDIQSGNNTTTQDTNTADEEEQDKFFKENAVTAKCHTYLRHLNDHFPRKSFRAAAGRVRRSGQKEESGQGKDI